MNYNKYFQILSITILFIFISKVYLSRSGTFGCSDQCHIFVSGYFMTKGKSLYSEIFFNHQMLAPNISFLIQKIFVLPTTYKLVQAHHIFVLLFSYLSNIFFTIQWGWYGVLFAFLFEATKYYYQGNLFLPESLIVYPLVYLVYLNWKLINKKKLKIFELFLIPFLVWFVVFMREPYIPLALFLYTFLLYQSPIKHKIIQVLIFAFISTVTLYLVSLPDYSEQVFLVNAKSVGINEIKNNQLTSFGLLKAFFYPLLILVEGNLTFLKEILLMLNILFLSMFVITFKKKRGLKIVFVFFTLGIAAIRYVTPGKMFFEAFHMLPWFGLFLIFIVLMIKDNFEDFTFKNVKLFYVVFLFYIIIFSFSSPKSVFQDRIDSQKEFATGFSSYFAYGQVIKILSNPGDTLFTDVWDELIYREAGLEPSYKYSLFIPVMKGDEKYEKARKDMFNKNSPTFYYSWCNVDDEYSTVPKSMISEYIHLLKNGNKSCLLVKKERVQNIDSKKVMQMTSLGFNMPRKYSSTNY